MTYELMTNTLWFSIHLSLGIDSSFPLLAGVIGLACMPGELDALLTSYAHGSRASVSETCSTCANNLLRTNCHSSTRSGSILLPPSVCDKPTCCQCSWVSVSPPLGRAFTNSLCGRHKPLGQMLGNPQPCSYPLSPISTISLPQRYPFL